MKFLFSSWFSRYTLTSESGTVNNEYVVTDSDFNVAAVVRLDGADVTSDLISAEKLGRTCAVTDAACGDALKATVACAFKVHVKTLSLEVKKVIEGLMADKTAKYNFEIKVTPAEASGIRPVTKTATLGNNDVDTLIKLPRGEFSVTEKDPKDNYNVSFKVNGQPVQVNSNTNEKAINGELSTDPVKTEVVVTNTLESVPTTGIADMMLHANIIAIAVSLAGLCLLGVYSRKKRNSR